MAGAIVVKQIKPDRFKDRAFAAALLAPMRQIERDMLKDFEATTATWKHDVKFEGAISESLGGVSVHIITTDKIYNYVNNGTRPHPIFAGAFTSFGGKKALRFQKGYKPKTQVRKIGSTPGGPHGAFVHAAYVNHPGTDPRNFDEEIQDKWEPRFKARMEKAMSNAAKASGHGIP